MSESARSILKHLYEEGRMTEYQYQKIDRNLKEPKQGEWSPVAELDTTNDFAEWIDVNGDGSLWKCSRCGETSCCRGKYCCECGARMKGGEE